MKLIFIRHGDPDYMHDSLTPEGWEEAKLVAERIKQMDVRDFYVSPLGRAKDTASVTLQAMGREGTECDWLREFGSPKMNEQMRLLMQEMRRTGVMPEHPKGPRAPLWDQMPSEFAKKEELLDPEKWKSLPVYQENGVAEYYDYVCGKLDECLAGYGYRRRGIIYETEQGNNDTVVFFSHFGIGTVLLSHLLNLPVFPLWQGTCALTGSVTTVATEEREKGFVSFRMISFSDISHYYAAGKEPSFAGRYRECYENDWQRK